MATVNTSVKLDEDTKIEAQKLFKNLSLNLSTAINMFLKQAIREQGIPFKWLCNRIKNYLRHLKKLKKSKKILKNIIIFISTRNDERYFQMRFSI